MISTRWCVKRFEREGWTRQVWSGRTSAESGQVVLLHLAHQFGRYASRGTLVVRLGFPLAAPQTETLDPYESRSETVRLVLPPTGSASVELLGPNGATYERKTDPRSQPSAPT